MMKPASICALLLVLTAPAMAGKAKHSHRQNIFAGCEHIPLDDSCPRCESLDDCMGRKGFVFCPNCKLETGAYKGTCGDGPDGGSEFAECWKRKSKR
jgi:hypothetical protein